MRLATRIGAILIATTFCVSAMAQLPGGGRPGGGPQLSEEALAKAWEAQSTNVAKQLGLNEELTKKLTETYKAAREGYGKALQEKISAGADRRDIAAMREFTVAERAKLETALKAFLNEEQTGKAIATLGTFNRGWDRMTSIVDGMGLDEKAKGEAMNAVSGYVAESSKAIEAALAAGNATPESMRETTQKLREKLNADMGKVLSAEQLAAWTEATAMRGPGGGGQRRNRDGEGAAAPGAPAPAPAGTPAAPPVVGGGKKEEKKAE